MAAAHTYVQICKASREIFWRPGLPSCAPMGLLQGATPVVWGSEAFTASHAGDG